jgi:hypothetical protein
MPDLVQDGVYPLGAGGTGADADEAVDAGLPVNRVRDGHPESRRNAGADEEIRNVVDAVAGGQIGGGEEVGLAEGQQISPQFRIRQERRSEEVDIRYTAARGSGCA